MSGRWFLSLSHVFLGLYAFPHRNLEIYPFCWVCTVPFTLVSYSIRPHLVAVLPYECFCLVLVPPHLAWSAKFSLRRLSCFKSFDFVLFVLSCGLHIWIYSPPKWTMLLSLILQESLVALYCCIRLWHIVSIIVMGSLPYQGQSIDVPNPDMSQTEAMHHCLPDLVDNEIFSSHWSVLHWLSLSLMVAFCG